MGDYINNALLDASPQRKQKEEAAKLVKKWDKKMGEDFIWSDVRKLIKNYQGFLTIDVKQCRIHLLKLIEESD